MHSATRRLISRFFIGGPSLSLGRKWSSGKNGCSYFLKYTPREILSPFFKKIEKKKRKNLCQTTNSFENLEIIDTLKENIKNYYWSYINVYLVKSFEERNLIEKVTAKLIEYKRPFSAIKLLSRSKNIRTELIILTLEKSIELFDSVENNGMTIKHE